MKATVLKSSEARFWAVLWEPELQLCDFSRVPIQVTSE